MKKAFLIITLIIISSCSSDDSSETTNYVANLNPPEWIIGTWLSQEIEYNSSGWKFTSNDAIEILQGNDQLGIKELITRTLNNWDELTNQDQILQETITDNYYSIIVTYYHPKPNARSDFTFRFNKISETEIQWVTAPTSVNPLNMTKQ